MDGFKRYAGLICSILILILAIIHLAVSSSIIGKFRHYDDVFRPEVGLSAFNIVISILALLIGGFGLFSALTHRGNLGKLIGLVSIVLAIFVLASLIAALVINSSAINYVDSHFSNHMDRYESSRNSRETVDRIQTKYDCCGSDTWLEWTRVSLNATTTTTTTTTIITTTTTPITNITVNTTTPIGNGTQTTTIATNTTTITSITTGEITVTGEGGTSEGLTNPAANNDPESFGNQRAINDPETSDNRIERSIVEENAVFEFGQDNDKIVDENFNFFYNSFEETMRQRRQARVNYGDIHNLPADFIVTFPASCCTSDLSSINGLSNQYCFSNVNNGQNSFHTDGCARKLGKDAVGQSLGLAVINSLLLILTVAAIYVFIKDPSSTNHPQAAPASQPAYQYAQQNGSYPANNYYDYGYHNHGQPVYATEYGHAAPSAYSAVPSYAMYH